MPTGKVKFYDAEKGFGFITTDEGQQVYLHVTALPAEVTALKPGTRLEFGVAEGRRGPQALSVRVLDELPSVAKRRRKAPDDMAVILGDLIRVLEGATEELRHGRYPNSGRSKQVAQMLRRVAEDFDV